ADAERLGGQHRLRAGRRREAPQEGDAGGGRELADARGHAGGGAPAAVLVRTALGVGRQGRVGVGDGDRVRGVRVGMRVDIGRVARVAVLVYGGGVGGAVVAAVGVVVAVGVPVPVATRGED